MKKLLLLFLFLPLLLVSCGNKKGKEKNEENQDDGVIYAFLINEYVENDTCLHWVDYDLVGDETIVCADIYKNSNELTYYRLVSIYHEFSCDYSIYLYSNNKKLLKITLCEDKSLNSYVILPLDQLE